MDDCLHGFNYRGCLNRDLLKGRLRRMGSDCQRLIFSVSVCSRHQTGANIVKPFISNRLVCQGILSRCRSNAALQHYRQTFKFILKFDTMTSRAAERVNKIRKQLPSGVKGGRHIHWHSHACSSIKFPARVNSVARPCSPRGLFSESHPSATSYSNGLTGEEESVSAHGWGEMEIVVIDGPVARGGSWVYEPEQI